MNGIRCQRSNARCALGGAALWVALAGSAAATDYYCVPLETTVRTDRAKVLCAKPVSSRYGYPKDPPSSVNEIDSFAVPLTDQAWADRFIRVADLAHVSGLTLRLSYTPGDFSGEAFGCQRQNCRTPWAFTLVKVPPVWPNAIMFLNGFEEFVKPSYPDAEN